MNRLFEIPYNHIVIISHLDEVICTMLRFDVDLLCGVLERDKIVNTAEFIGLSELNDLQYLLEFVINGKSFLKVDLLICKIE